MVFFIINLIFTNCSLPITNFYQRRMSGLAVTQVLRTLILGIFNTAGWRKYCRTLR